MSSEPTRVTVVQHGEKERTAGDPGLTPRGLEQARRVAERLAELPIDDLLCSPLRRARETAEPLALRAGVAARYDERLVERMNWDGSVPIEDFLADWDRATEDRAFVPHGGESSEVAGARFAAVVREFGERPGGHVVLVAHGGVTVDGLRTLVGDGEVSRALPGWRQGVPSAALTRLEVSAAGVTLLEAGDTSHLA